MLVVTYSLCASSKNITGIFFAGLAGRPRLFVSSFETFSGTLSLWSVTVLAESGLLYRADLRFGSFRVSFGGSSSLGSSMLGSNCQ